MFIGTSVNYSNLKFHLIQGLSNVDYESEVEDEMLSIFRKGEVGLQSIAQSFLFILDSWTNFCMHIFYLS